MNILPNIKAIGLSLFFEKEKILVIGDLHIGYEESLNKRGVLIPRMHLKEIISELDKIFKKVKPKKVILLGDVKHEFGTISDQEWDDTLKFLNYLLRKAEVILVKGNHDTILGPIAKKKKLVIKDGFFVNNVFFCHGHKLMNDNPDFKKAKTLIIGHEHPAISIRDGVRTEKYKCFLLGKYENKNLIVVPSFNSIPYGTDVLQQKLSSPFIKNIKEFKAFIVADKIYDFGKIGDLD